jgi:hypothetical protein
VHRFGRSGQQKLKDRWGGSFILVAVLALVGSYYLGNYLNNNLWGKSTTGSGLPVDPDGNGSDLGDLGSGNLMAADPKSFNLYVVQVGAFQSPKGAQNLAETLQQKGQVSFASINMNGLSYTYVGGVYSEKKVADKLVDDLKQAKVIDVGLVRPFNVSYAAQAVTAMAGQNGAQLQTTLATLNSYLQEAAAWFEARANNQNPDVTHLTGLGNELANLATQLEKAAGTDENMKRFAAAAKAAGENATQIKAAAAAQTHSPQFQASLGSYMNLIAQYGSIQSGNATSSHS